MNAKKLLSYLLALAIVVTMASFPALAEDPTLITGITVTADNFTPADDSRPMTNLVDGVNGLGAASIDWMNQLISNESYDTGDGTTALFTFYYDLGAKYNVTNFFVGIGWDGPTVASSTLYGSNDNATWTPVKTGITTTWGEDFDGGYRGVYDIEADAYQYFKYEVTKLDGAGQMYFHETAFTGTLATGGTEPTPPPAGGGSNTPASGDTKQVVLTEANLTINRIFDNGWEGTATFSNPANLFDGDATTYSEWDQYKSDGETADCLCEFIIDFGTVKNITNVTVYTGAEHFGPDWWSNAAPMNAEILVAGEDEVYTSVYTYDSDTVEETRTDATDLDPNAEGNGVRYVKYRFNKVARRATVAEIEITEITAAAPATYTVEYVDQNGDEVLPSKEVTEGFFVGDVVNETAPVVEDYDNVNTTASITLVDGENTITFEYFKKTPATYTVNYVDAQGNPVANAKTVSTGVYVDDEVTEYAVAAPGFVVSGDSSATITLIDGTNTITFVYDVYVSISGEHSKLTHLTGADVTTSVEGNEYTNLDNLFDGDTTAANEPGDTSGNPTFMNGYYSSGWNNAISFVIDLGDIYELSKIDTYWGWAPAEHPTWNSWQYQVPGTYTIYVADTLEGLDTAAPAAVVTGLERDPETFLGDSSAELATWGRYVKIAADPTGAQLALREITFVGTEFIDPSNNTTVTVEYEDENGNTLAPSIDITKTTGKVFDIEPIAIAGYSPITGTQTVTFDADKTITIVYKAIYSVEVAPAEDGTYSDGSETVPFVFTVATPENIAPTDAFAAANWVTTNCEIVDVKVEADGMLGFVYAWKVVVTVAPTANEEFTVELDLPDEYELTDIISITRAPSKATLDSAIAIGENSVEVSTNRVIIEFDDKGKIKTENNLRKVHVVLNLQTISETLLPYKGYEDVVIELKDIRSAGKGFSYNKANFVKVGDTYIGELLANNFGIDQLNFEIAIYGVAADGTKTELDTAIVKSGIIQVTAPDPKPTPTKAESIAWKILPIDIITQLYGQIHPSALPTIVDSDWELYKEVVGVRGTTMDIDAMKAEYEAYRVSEPTGEYTDNLVIDVKKQIEASVYLWNFLKDIEVDTITFTNLAVTAVTDDGIEAVNDIESVNVTFRNGIDYDKLNALTGGNFNLRIRINIDDSGEKASLIGKAYNAVRRALNDDQVMPLFFRLDWYTWADLPFTGAVFTVKVSEKWIDNNGAFNLVAYHVEPWTYSYEQDNTPTITKVQDNLTITPMTRELSFAVDGGSNGSAIYDTYVIVSTNKLPSELPETID